MTPTPHFKHERPNVGQRPIDDGLRYGHNGSTECVETLGCRTAMQPGIHVKYLAEACKNEGVARQEIAGLVVESGGGDQPDARRWAPNAPEEVHLNIAAVHVEDPKSAMVREVWGHVW